MANCAAWEPVHINAGDKTEGFSIDQGNLKWSEQNGFGGWLGMLSFLSLWTLSSP